MATFTTNSFNDVLVLAKTFGTDALEFAIKNNTVNVAFPSLVRECKTWATRQIVELQNVNDGNIEYSLDAVFKAELVLDRYETNLKDITVVRTGFGAYIKPALIALSDGDINTDTLEYIINDVRNRNEARKVLGL